MSTTVTKSTFYKKICNTPFKVTFLKKGRIDYDIELENTNTCEKYKGSKPDSLKIEDKKAPEPAPEPAKSSFFSRFTLTKAATPAPAQDLTIARDLLETVMKGSDPNLICDLFYIYQPSEEGTKPKTPNPNPTTPSDEPLVDLGGLELMIEDRSDPNNIIKYKQKVKKLNIPDVERLMAMMTPEPIHYVSKAEFLNNWTNFSIKNGSEETLGYYKHMGRVYLSGLVCNGEMGEKKPLFILPETYRPARVHVFVVDCGRKLGSLDVFPNGEVCLMKGVNGFVSLAGISYRADC